MGSRKKKKQVPRHFIAWWRALNPNDRIAFKAFWYFWGRGRRVLREFFTMPEIIGNGGNYPITWQYWVDCGYTWMHDREKYPPASKYKILTPQL